MFSDGIEDKPWNRPRNELNNELKVYLENIYRDNHPIDGFDNSKPSMYAGRKRRSLRLSCGCVVLFYEPSPAQHSEIMCLRHGISEVEGWTS
jgi:hypothetical protein